MGSLLLERDDELASLHRILERSAGGDGSGRLLEGDAGVGKTSLIEAFCSDADDRGLVCLRGKGVEAERGYPLGVVRQVITPFATRVLRGDPDLLAGPAAPARDLLAVPEAAGADSLEAFHALYWLLVNASEQQPLAIAVDDAHLADDASVRFLAFLSQRLWAHPIALVISQRPDPRLPAGLAREVAVRSVAPLSDAAAARILGDVLGETAPEFVEACHRVTGGNPFLLSELAHELRTEHVPPTAASVTRVRAVVPEAVRRMAVIRLAGLDQASLALARASAVLGEGVSHRLAAEVADVGPGHAPAALDHLVAAEVLGPDQTVIRFRHPLVQAAIYEEISVGARAELHERAAKALLADGAPVEIVASHLLHAPRRRDPHAVALLRSAAESAGASETAAALLERALEEGVPDDRCRLELELARALEHADPERAEGLLTGLMEHPQEPDVAAEAALDLGRLRHTAGRFPEAAAALDRGLDLASGVSRRLELRMFAEYVATASLSGADISTAMGRSIDLADQVDPATADVAELEAMAALALQISMRSNDPRGVDLAERALAGGRLIELAGGGSPAVSMAVGVLNTADDLEQNFAHTDAAVRDAQRRGSPIAFAAASYLRAACTYHLGRIDDTVADSEAAIHGAVDGWQQYVPAAYAFLALSLVELGEPAAALERLAEIDSDAWRGSLVLGVATGVRGVVRAHLGDVDGSLDDLRTWGRLFPVPNPAFWCNWRSASAQVLARIGRRDEALALAEEEIALLGEHAPPRALGMALGARAIALTGDAQVEGLREALAILDRSKAELHQCRARLELGSALRRAGERVEARELLRAASLQAQRLGLVALGTAADHELVAAGAQPRRRALRGPASLTPGEVRVARMAASGLTNREIAARLFVTPKAVGYHLGNVYRKLEIAGRAELATALAADRDDEAAGP